MLSAILTDAVALSDALQNRTAARTVDRGRIISFDPAFGAEPEYIGHRFFQPHTVVIRYRPVIRGAVHGEANCAFAVGVDNGVIHDFGQFITSF